LNSWLRANIRHPANWVERSLFSFNAWLAVPRSPFDWALDNGWLRSNRAIHRAWRVERTFRVLHGLVGLAFSAVLAVVVIISECWHRATHSAHRE
jgi:hypothetical protein